MSPKTHVLLISTAAALLSLLNGCSLLPKWKINQKTVPAAYVKTVQDLEAEKQAALFISQSIIAPEYLIPVAKSLSLSIGLPAVAFAAPHSVAGASQVSAKTNLVISHVQDARQKQDDFLNKYQGKTIEGTGFDVLAPAGGLGILGIIALLVFVPGSLSVLFWIIARLRGTVRTVATGIENFKAANPTVVQDLNNSLSKAMDEVHKKIVDEVKAKANL